MRVRIALGVLLAGMCWVASATLTTPARSDEDEPSFTLVVSDSTVRLGDDIELHAKFVNRSRDPVVVPALRLARDSITITLSAPDVNLQAHDLTRLYGQFHAGEGDAGPTFRQRATLRRRLAPGEELSVDLRVPALVLGDMTVRAALGTPGPGRWRTAPISVEVVPAGTGTELAAVVETTRGTVTLSVEPVPHYGAAAQFWSLARSGFYDGLTVHRVVRDRLVQTGDPRGDGAGDAGWFVPSSRIASRFRSGDVGLARGAHPDSASSQWFIALGDGPSGDYARFARVTAGRELLRLLRAGDSPDSLRSVSVEVR